MGGVADPELVAAIERAYRDGYRRYLRVAAAMLGDVDRGRDAVREAFARALRSRDDLRPLDGLDGWLWRTVANTCLAELRRPLAVDEAYRPDANGYAEDWPELHAAVAALPDRLRLVLFLRHYADLDYRAIADAVGVERGTVAATLNAAHRKLRDALMEVPR